MQDLLSPLPTASDEPATRAARALTYLRGDAPAVGQDLPRGAACPVAAVPALDASALTEVLEAMDVGVIVCGEDGRVVHANDAGRRELRRGQSLGVDAAGLITLPAVDTQAMLRLWNALRGAVRAGRRELIPLRDGPRMMTLSVLPLAAGEDRLAMLLLGRRQPAPDLAVAMLARQASLTEAEAGVLHALLSGARLEEVAAQRGTKISTLRTQAASLRAKLGVKRLEDLVRVAGELPPMGQALRSPPLSFAVTPYM
jgi:DNA-binding CsgD family transcriptional regulator